MSEQWTNANMPRLDGRLALVTGANSGIGLRAADTLAAAGAEVLMGCRDPEKAEAALRGVREANPGAEVEALPLDLADLASIEAAAAQVNSHQEPLSLLINNAGVMAPPRQETADGFELQLGTNHLGHFALTGRVLDKLLAADHPRVVNVSSLAHSSGKMDFDDLNWEQSYSRWPAYGRSKLANLLFTFELDRRFREKDLEAIAVACHPGYSATNLQTAGPGAGTLGFLLKPAFKLANVFLAQSDEMGALPTLYAATAPGVEGSDFIGPDGLRQMRGHPTNVGCTSAARDPDDARRLWEASEKLTGVRYGPLE